MPSVPNGTIYFALNQTVTRRKSGMEKQKKQLIDQVNRAIIKFRGIYSEWSSRHSISYNEMLVLYTIREFGFCTQKQICDSYLLPKQTVNNVIAALRTAQLLEYSEEYSRGREKAFVLTEKGRDYAAPFLASLDGVEERALELLGEDKLRTLTALLLEYDRTLGLAMDESEV